MLKYEGMLLMGYGDAINFLKISDKYFDKVVAKGMIPYHKTSSGKIFFKEDIEKFDQQRRIKAKTDKRVKIKD